ncbi:MAG: hypothetical protein J6X81_01720 [Muribaculaceae bacterium]|nr:hypothetical protein [Muribaculaceae bacterium]
MMKKKIRRICARTIGVLAIVCLVPILACNRVVVNDAENKVGTDNDSLMQETNTDVTFHCINSVLAHNEQDTIVGNFTGKGIDTLYVVYDNTKEDGDKWQYYAKSNNKAIPRLNLYGCRYFSPKLVNEGDLDGNGTCDVGYLHTWVNSQWRYYRILTLVNGEWRYLVAGDYLDTSEWFRCSGSEVAESSGQKGTVLIHYACRVENTDQIEFEIKDTIVEPKFLKIKD